MQDTDWQKIVDQHGPSVWATAYRLLDNYTDACDCFSEVFVSALEISSRQNIRNFYALLIRLTTWRAIDQLRKRLNHRKISADTNIINNVTGSTADPNQQAQINELSDQLRMALSKLPEKEAQAFCLRHLNDFSYEQIAEELNIKLSNTGVLLHRAKIRLREILSLEKELENEVVL